MHVDGKTSQLLHSGNEAAPPNVMNTDSLGVEEESDGEGWSVAGNRKTGGSSSLGSQSGRKPAEAEKIQFLLVLYKDNDSLMLRVTRSLLSSTKWQNQSAALVLTIL